VSVLSPEEQQEYEQLKDIVDAFKPLVSHHGWITYQNLLEKQIRARVLDPPTPSDGVGGVLRSEFVRGEVSGMIHAKGLVEAMLVQAETLMKEYIERINQEIENGDEA